METSAIREEELKNRVAALFFGKYDCTRIVGNIDFCVSPKRRDPRQMMFIPDTPILWAEAKNRSVLRHPRTLPRLQAKWRDECEIKRCNLQRAHLRLALRAQGSCFPD